jgi:hypothetical protein
MVSSAPSKFAMDIRADEPKIKRREERKSSGS